jgi:hypothetical protein
MTALQVRCMLAAMCKDLLAAAAAAAAAQQPTKMPCSSCLQLLAMAS